MSVTRTDRGLQVSTGKYITVNSLTLGKGKLARIVTPSLSVREARIKCERLILGGLSGYYLLSP